MKFCLLGLGIRYLALEIICAPTQILDCVKSFSLHFLKCVCGMSVSLIGEIYVERYRIALSNILQPQEQGSCQKAVNKLSIMCREEQRPR